MASGSSPAPPPGSALSASGRPPPDRTSSPARSASRYPPDSPSPPPTGAVPSVHRAMPPRLSHHGSRVPDMDIRTDRVGILLDQLESSVDISRDRLAGLTDEEYLW